MIRPLTIQAKLLGIFLVAAVLPLALVSVLSYNNSLKAVEEMVGNRTNRLAVSVGEDLSRKLSRRLYDGILYTNQPVQDFLDETDPQKRVRSLLALSAYSETLFDEYSRYYREMILADADGEPVFRFGRSRGRIDLRDILERGDVETVIDSIAAPDFPSEIPRQARDLEAWRRTLESSIRAQAQDLESLDLGRPPAPPDPIDEQLIEALSQAFRGPLGSAENLEFAGPDPAGGSNAARRLAVARLIGETFTKDDRLAARNALQLGPGENQIFIHRSESGAPLAVRMVRPVFSVKDSTRRLGGLILDLRIDYLFPENLSGERFGSRGNLAVVDVRSGEILFHTEPRLQGQDMRIVNPVLAAAVKTVAGRPGEAPRSWTKISGDEGIRLATVMELDAVGWAVVATSFPREFEKEARQAGVINLLVASIAVLLAAFVLLTSSRRISGSIHKVTDGAREIAAGNLNHTIRISTHDEIQTLADTFNTMTVSLRESISLREKAARELEGLNRTLEDRVQERTRELVSVNDALNQANQELKELDRLKSNFLATVSHEFRTPLTSITAFSEILVDEMAEREAPPEVKRFLSIINTESERLGRLIKNLLDLSRIEAGRMRWDRSRFPIQDVLDAACDGLLPVFAQKQIDVIRDNACPEARVKADRDRIQQVITNLIENAVKFSAKGSRIWVSCVRAAESGNGHPWIHVTVRDEGPGIPGEHLVRIFERFSQVDNTDTRGTGGSGLGLAISREIVEHHGGRIWAESAPGQGAAFHFTLPCAGDDDSEIDVPVQKAGKPGASNEVEPMARRGDGSGKSDPRSRTAEEEWS